MTVVLVLLWVSIGALIATLAIAFGVRVSGSVVHRRSAHYAATLKATLSAFAAQVGEEPAAPRTRLQRRLMQRDLLALRPNLKGEAGAELSRLFVSFGLSDHARRDLTARSVVARRHAAEVLGAMPSSRTRRALLAGLADRDRLVRLGCARALAEIGQHEDVPRVLDALAGEADHPQDAVGILRKFAGPAVPHLRQQLSAPTGLGQQRLAAGALGAGHALAAVPELRALLGADDHGLVADAARALGNIGDLGCVPQLAALAGGHENPKVRQQACTALGTIDDPSVRSALADSLGDEVWEVREAAAHALVALGPAQVAQAVAESEPSARTAPAAAHAAGTLDVMGRLQPVIASAADGDPSADVFVRRACQGGARVRLAELADRDDHVGAYSASVLAASERSVPLS